jgi:hypothetical protein
MTELNRWYKLEGKALKKWVMHLENGFVEVIAYPGREILWRALVRNPRRKIYQQLGVDPPERLFMVVATGTEPSSMEKAGEKALAAHRRYVKHPPKTLFNESRTVWTMATAQYHAYVSVDSSLRRNRYLGRIYTIMGDPRTATGEHFKNLWAKVFHTKREAISMTESRLREFVRRGQTMLFNRNGDPWERVYSRMWRRRMASGHHLYVIKSLDGNVWYWWIQVGKQVGIRKSAASFAEAKEEALKTYRRLKLPMPMLFNARRNADPRFAKLAEAQRGRPESAMLRIQMAGISQLYGTTAEHVGDLTHRMSEYPEHAERHKAGYQYVLEKVKKTLRWLTNAYGFEREVREQVITNWNYMREKGDPYVRAKHFGGSPEDALRRLKRLGRLYAAEHRRLPVFNAVQRIARDAAIAVGEWRFKDAVDRLYALKYLLEQGPEAWSREAMKTKNNPKPRNPWAICAAVGLGRGTAKYERCVKKVKAKMNPISPKDAVRLMNPHVGFAQLYKYLRTLIGDDKRLLQEAAEAHRARYRSLYGVHIGPLYKEPRIVQKLRDSVHYGRVVDGLTPVVSRTLLIRWDSLSHSERARLFGHPATEILALLQSASRVNPRRVRRSKTYFVARFRPPYPQRGEFWTASESIDTLPATVVGGVYKISAANRVTALAQAKAAHARGR